MACHGGSLSYLDKCPCRLVQRQHTHCPLGATHGVETFENFYAIGASIGPSAAACTRLASHPFAHCRRPKCTERHTVEIVWLRPSVDMPNSLRLTLSFQHNLSSPTTGILDRLPTVFRDMYSRDFHIADEAFHNGRMEATSSARTKYWSRWVSYVAIVGVDPYLQETTYTWKARLLTGFAARVRSGFYGRKAQVSTGAVNSAITAIGTTIALARGINPTKIEHSDKLIPRLSQMFDGWRKADPPVIKKLPVEVDVPELLCRAGHIPTANELDRTIGDLALIAYYYLLRVGEYTTKNSCNYTKQTTQFRLRDITFFKINPRGDLRQLGRTAPITDILTATSATLKLDNQKNGWRGVCIHHEANGNITTCPVRALARRVAHLRRHNAPNDCFLSSFYVNTSKFDVTDTDVRKSLKQAATILHYPSRKGIPIERVDTHSLRSGGANALSLAGYSDREIQKMGRWRSATFKEYIREELACFSAGMSTKMKHKFGFVNIAGGAYHDITSYLVDQPDSVATNTVPNCDT